MKAKQTIRWSFNCDDSANVFLRIFWCSAPIVAHFPSWYWNVLIKNPLKDIYLSLFIKHLQQMGLGYSKCHPHSQSGKVSGWCRFTRSLVLSWWRRCTCVHTSIASFACLIWEPPFWSISTDCYDTGNRFGSDNILRLISKCFCFRSVI